VSRPVTPQLAVDCVLFDARDRLLLIERKYPPFQGGWALPGGFVDVGESVERAAVRELHEETGIAFDPADLTLIGVYSDPDRDPRGHTVAIAYGARLTHRVEPRAADDAARAEWVEGWESLSFAFDHGDIIADAHSKLFR